MQPVKGDLNGDLWRANNLYEEMGTQPAIATRKPLGIQDHDIPSSKMYVNWSVKAKYFHLFSSPFSVDDADYEEYETMNFQQYNSTHTSFPPASAPESVDEEEYEPVSMRLKLHDGDLAIQTSNSSSVYVNNEEYEELTEGAADRPLPTPPATSGINKDFYEHAVNSQQMRWFSPRWNRNITSID